MRSIITQEDSLCFVCKKAWATETHHVFEGIANRKISDRDGLTIRVCKECHNAIHNGNRSKALMKALHELGQEKWEAYYGPDLEKEGKDPRKVFMERYGKNWL